ncbi:MAG: pyridoxine 5'-phosphate synthase [Bacteroidota bacterium]|nr:pyridoxine 5'-phosphate synthase [Bacteroidota bacterium]
MVHLSVNINKIATIRNARGGNTPNVVGAAIKCQCYGADGITVHPREDQRHITDQDVYDIKDEITTEYNIEGYPSKRFINMILNIKPDQVTLVPDTVEVITSNSGWDTIKHTSFLKEIVSEFQSNKIRTSIFVNPDVKMIQAVEKTGTDRIELYTGSYASDFSKNKEKAIRPYVISAEVAKEMNIGINAGHDLNLDNLEFFCKNIKFLNEVSIGHALISDSLYFGLENTIQMYKRLI